METAVRAHGDLPGCGSRRPTVGATGVLGQPTNGRLYRGFGVADQRSALPDSAHHVEHFVARAHGVVIGLAGRALLVAVRAVVRIQDAIPGTVAMVDHVLPGVAPQLVVPVPVHGIAGAL